MFKELLAYLTGPFTSPLSSHITSAPFLMWQGIQAGQFNGHRYSWSVLKISPRLCLLRGKEHYFCLLLIPCTAAITDGGNAAQGAFCWPGPKQTEQIRFSFSLHATLFIKQMWCYITQVNHFKPQELHSGRCCDDAVVIFSFPSAKQERNRK